MPAIKYDVSDVESGSVGEQAKPGLYKATISSVTDRREQDGKNDLEVVVDIGRDYARVWSYVNFGESSRWKFREFTDALGLPPKGSLDPKKLEGKKLQVKIIGDTYNGEYRARIGKFIALGEKADDDADADDDGDAEDYSSWTDEELWDEIEALEIEFKGRKSRAKMIKTLEEYSESSAESGDDEEAAEADETDAADDEPSDDYDTWPSNELKDEVKDRGLAISGRPTKEKMIAALREDDGDGDPFSE